MKRIRTASSRQLAFIAATILALAGGAVGIAQAVGGSGNPPRKPLANALYDAAHARDVQGITARIKFTNSLLPSGSLPEGSGSPLMAGASGRLWLAAGGRLRVELQSDAGDAQIVSDGTTLSVYDASSNTVYTGALPRRSRGAGKDKRALTLPGIRDGLAQLAKTWTLSGATPGNTAGQPSYTVRIAPKDDGGLLGAAELAWDAARGVPLRVAIYSQGQTGPVLELRATEIAYGRLAASEFNVKPPGNARVVEFNPRLAHDARGRPTEIHGIADVSRRAEFAVTAPATLAGLPRRAVRLVRFDGDNAALASYGEGLGAILVLERQAGAKSAQTPDGVRLPTINIDGATGTELATALGTVVQFERNGVDYTVVGSVPPLAAENAARGLK